MIFQNMYEIFCSSFSFNRQPNVQDVYFTCVVTFYFSLRGMQAKVVLARQSSPLFNTKTYATNLETLFYQMWKQHETQGIPSHITDVGGPTPPSHLHITQN